MVKFSVEKKALEEAAVMLVQVAGLKSIGAPPSESSGIYLTPTTMTLVNSNEANSVMVEDIPITVGDGDINAHIEQAYMINTKKFASIIKGSKVSVNFLITESKVAIGEGNRRFDLAIFSAPKKELPAINLFDYKVDVKEVLKNISCADLITAQASNITELSGTLFSADKMFASDRLSALYIEKGGLFAGAPEMEDIVVAPDLFSTCLSKTKEKEVLVGFTEDKQRVVLKFGNVTLAKGRLTSKFPKEDLLKAVLGVQTTIKKGVLKATVSLNEFVEKLHEIREIVESDEYHIKFNREGTIEIANNNLKSGTEGTVVVDATVTMGDDLGDEIGGKFAYAHLDLFGKLFSGEDNVELHSSVGVQGTSKVLRYLAVKTDGKVFFCTPKS